MTVTPDHSIVTFTLRSVVSDDFTTQTLKTDWLIYWIVDSLTHSHSHSLFAVRAPLHSLTHTLTLTLTVSQSLPVSHCRLALALHKKAKKQKAQTSKVQYTKQVFIGVYEGRVHSIISCNWRVIGIPTRDGWDSDGCPRAHNTERRTKLKVCTLRFIVDLHWVIREYETDIAVQYCTSNIVV